MSEYRVNLDVYSGPMDLLLYLIRKEEVDIYDISITKIANQYLESLESLKRFDIDIAGDFLVMAATLMQIKSAMLLPPSESDQEQDGEPLDGRAELIRQLLEYKKYKDAANILADTAEQQMMRTARPDTILKNLKPESEPEMDMENVSVWDLLETFDALMSATGKYMDISHIADDTPIDFYQIEVLSRLQSDGPMSFERIFEGQKNRHVMIGMFLGMLELIREKLIHVDHDEESGNYYVKAVTDVPAEQAVSEAIIAASALMQDDQEQTQKEELSIPIIEVPDKKQEAEINISQQNEQSIPIAEVKSGAAEQGEKASKS
ncbi:MAG: segregation/condensation protein A [Phycisphaerae bacterium]|nr:segregation/condensation protein A [Phycisphaerae bacterium]